MTPDQIKVLFDGNSILIMFVVGLLWKYLPQLKNWTNEAIPWVNLVGYILAKIIGNVTAAHAAVTPEQAQAALGVGGIVVGAFTSATWARLLYEGFGRLVMEKLFKVKNPAAQ